MNKDRKRTGLNTTSVSFLISFKKSIYNYHKIGKPVSDTLKMAGLKKRIQLFGSLHVIGKGKMDYPIFT
ncbi:hypothetical protein SAMN04488121_101232 [Chitinophaga filiformis]|uniref:Uncharacterized protein n=1 Tax=Chitinophaga filiformis TaxID=104663 RepID=A0A1G7GZF6_CHIFI|nr:hypothetical protein SAMN04488121_101232 [Chitinophaga filiformis]